MDDVPVQFFQSVIAIQLAVTGALLWNIRYFERRPGNDSDGESTPNPWLLLLVAVVLTATLFGCLYSIRHAGQEAAASTVTVGLALSMIPILLRVMPPLRRPTHTERRQPNPAVTILALILYFAAVATVVVGLNT